MIQTIWQTQWYAPTRCEPDPIRVHVKKNPNGMSRAMVLDAIRAGVFKAADIAKLVGISDKSVRDHLHRLIDQGLIVGTHVPRSCGKMKRYEVKK